MEQFIIHSIYAILIIERDDSYQIADLLLSLPWLKRLKIAVEAAKGLAFLHEAEKPVIYGDFKASNILLDSVSVDLCSISSCAIFIISLL